MKKIPHIDKEATEANLALTEELEDGNIRSSYKGVSDTASANLKLQDAFYDEQDKSDIAPTYMNNNTPAIKINPKD